MAQGFDWAPDWVQLRLRIALGAAFMRVWVGSIVLLAGITLALINFRAPQSPASIEQIVLNYQERAPLGTSSASSGAAGGPAAADRAKPVRRQVGTERVAQLTAAPWVRRPVVAASVEASEAASRLRMASDAEALSGYELTRALQKELRRVGCYYGEIDGDWGPGSKRAMSGFNDRVNASLPIETPDHILLKMVQGYAGEACGSCRPGEGRNGSNRCVPIAVLAHNDASRDRQGSGMAGAQRIESIFETVQPERRAAEPLPGRMAVGAAVDEVDTSAPVTRQAANESDSSSRPRRTVRRARVADRSPYTLSPQRRQKNWAQTFFEELSRR